MLTMKTKIYPTPRQQRFLFRQFRTLFDAADKAAKKILSGDQEKLERYVQRAELVEVPAFEPRPNDIAFIYPEIRRQGAERVQRQYRKNQDVIPVFSHQKMSFKLTNYGRKRFAIIGKHIYLGKGFRLKMTRVSRFKEKPLALCLIFDHGVFWASINYDISSKQPKRTHKAVGIDLGIKALATCVDSDGVSFQYQPQRFLTDAQSQSVIRLQQSLSRKVGAKKGESKSKAFLRDQRKIRAIHRKVTFRKEHAYFCLAKRLLRDYDTIGLETLDIKQMLQGGVGRSYRLHPFYGLAIILKEKASTWGKQLICIDRYYPSSQICSSCGYRNRALKDLSIRAWRCPRCGVNHDRDLNAAKNILRESLNPSKRSEGGKKPA